MKYGGSQRMLLNIINNIELRDRRKVIYLYNAHMSSDLENKLDDKIVIYKCSNTSFLKNFHRIYLLIKIIKKENVQKILSFATNGTYLSIFAKIFFPFRKIPIIYRMVSIDSALTYSSNKFISIIKKFFYYNFLCNKVELIISQTDKMKREISKKISLKNQNKIITIYNFLSVNKLLKKSLIDIDLNYKYIVFVGRLSKEKNIIEIIEAFSNVKDKINCKILIIGDGDMDKEIKDYVELNKLQSYVIFLGHQANPYKYIKKAECLVLFSLYEGFPNIIIESMLCKTPVISSNFKGVYEIIDNNNNGYIVENRNVKQLSDKIFEVVTDTKLTDMVTSQAYNYATEISVNSVNSYSQILNEN